jgi:phosphoglycolate phosphatase
MKIGKYKHIIWDWNGTLLDDLALSVELINGVLIKRNLPTLTVENYREIFTFPVKDYYAKTGLDFDIESFEVVGKEWMDGYEARKYECRLANGAVDVLQLMQSNKIPQSILSAYSQNSLRKFVSDFKLEEYFSHLIGLDHIYATSKVELGKTLIANLQLQRGEALLIGDTLHDFEVASEIGADAVLIASGHQDKFRLMSANVPVFDSMEHFYKSISAN